MATANINRHHQDIDASIHGRFDDRYCCFAKGRRAQSEFDMGVRLSVAHCD
jgi:hypothetical protein